MPSAEALAAESKRKDRLRALADLTKAGKIVHGDYYLQGETIQFHAWVEDMAAKKNILALEPASGPVKDPAAALEPLRLRLMGGLAGVFDPVLRDWLSLLKEPPKFEAYREYMEGSEAFYCARIIQKPWNISSGLQNAIRVSKWLDVCLLSLYTIMDQYAKAEELAQEVAKSRADLSTGERLFLDLMQAGLRGDSETPLRTCPPDRLRFTKRGIGFIKTRYEAIFNNYPQEAVDLLNPAWIPITEAYKDWSANYWGVLTSGLPHARRS